MFNFGSATNNPTTQSSGLNFNFGQSAPAQSTFGQPTATPGFGQPSAAPSFGQTTATPSFGQPSVSSAFGQPAANQTAFGGLNTSGLNTSGFNASGIGTGGFNFGGTGTQLNLTQPAITTQTTQALALTTPSVGLGGEGASSQAAVADSKSPKDTQTVPTEIVSLVEAFKTFVKDQKTLCDENCQPRFSAQPIIEINTELDENFKSTLQKLDVTLEKNKTAVDAVKKETNLLVSDAENAFRNIKALGLSSGHPSYPFGQTPAMSPIRTSAYFDRLISQFEQQMSLYSKQIQELESHLSNMNKPFLPHEVVLIVRKQHDTLVALAAEIYALHDRIQTLDIETSKGNRFNSTSSWGHSPAPSSQSKSYVGPNPFSMAASSSPQVPHGTIGVRMPSAVPSFQSPAPLSNFSFGSPSIANSPNRAKRWTTS